MRKLEDAISFQKMHWDMGGIRKDGLMVSK